MTDKSHAIIFTVVTVAFLILAGFLLYAFHDDARIYGLALSIITGLLGLWVPSPVQAKQP
jgi:hypothetical protein